MCPTSIKKTSLKSIPQLVSILVPTWLHFGRVLGGDGSQVGTKSLQKSIQRMIKKMITFWMALETDFDQFWLQLGGVKRGPLEAQFLTFFALGPHLSWSWPPNPPMTPPRSLLDPPRTPPRGLLGSILASISKDFACISGLGIYVAR